MPTPGVHVETLHNPVLYEPRQIEQAVQVAETLNRGKLVLCILPPVWPPQ
jgi:hypothetical protein